MFEENETGLYAAFARFVNETTCCSPSLDEGREDRTSRNARIKLNMEVISGRPAYNRDLNA